MVEPDEDEDATDLLPDEHSVPPTIPVVPEEEKDVLSSGRKEKSIEKEERKRTKKYKRKCEEK